MGDKIVLLENGVPTDRLNGMTPEQFRALVVQTEAALMGRFQGNTGMMATCIVELIVRMTMDADELNRELGDKLIADFHTSLDETVAYWRDHYAKLKEKLMAEAGGNKANLH